MEIKTIDGALKAINTEEPKGKVIRKASIARQILHKGGKDVRIIDIKMDKSDESKRRTVFVFEDTEKFQKIFADVIAENEKTRSKKNNKKTEIGLQTEIDNLKKKFEELTKMTEAVNKAKE